MPPKLYQAKLPVDRFAAGGVANRATATADGALMTMQPIGTDVLAGSASVRTATRIVAATDASAEMKAVADYLCDGVADDVQINAALASLPASGGVVLLSEGTFTIAAPVATTAANQAVRGMGMGATTLFAVNAGGTPLNDGLIKLNYGYSEVSDLTVDGNKANNAAQTLMHGVRLVAGGGHLVQRVRGVNSAGWGMVVLVEVQGSVIRDCLIENAATIGAILRAPAANPLVVSGCTFKGSGANGGVWCDDGPILLSDCMALSNSGGGFVALAAAVNSSFVNCVAQSNTNYGFGITGTNSQVINCQAISNTNQGFVVNGTAIQVVGCMAYGSSVGYLSNGSVADALFSGCTSIDATNHSFQHTVAATVMYEGCRALNPGSYGFLIQGGSAHIHDCQVYGSIGSSGIYCVDAGSHHTIDGCVVANNGGYGIIVVSPVTDVQITHNYCRDNSLAANATYSHIQATGDRAFVHGNKLYDPAAGNRPLYGVNVNATSSFVGHNDSFGLAGTPNNATGTLIRRASELQLNYTAAVDCIAGALAAATWTSLALAAGPVYTQSFTIETYGSLVEITVRGSILLGATTAGNVGMTRLVIDGDTANAKILGGEINEVGGYYQNILAGSQPVILQNLSVGSHTLAVQVHSVYAANVYCRASSASPQEFLQIQVMEHAR